MLTLKIEQLTINGTPILCPECGSEAFTLDGAGFIDAFPVRGNCWQSHSWEEPLITLGVLKEIGEARTGRQHVDDVDTFRVVVGDAVLEGVLYPDVIVDDLKMVAKDVYWKRIIRPGLRRQKNAAKRAIKRPAKNAVASAKAAAIGAAWGIQAGGYETDPDYQLEPVTPCIACDGKGGFNIKSRIHDTTHVKCTVCSGTGEAD